MRLVFSTTVLVLLWSCVGHGQWLKLDPIVRIDDLPDGHQLWGIEINDLGQALYATSEFVGGNPTSIHRIYVDDQLLVEIPATFSSERPVIGGINDNGAFAYAANNAVFVGQLDGTIETVVECCDLQLFYDGLGDWFFSPPRIDGEGRTYFVASTLEQMPMSQEFGIDGAASIYTGPNAESDFAVAELFVKEVDSDPRYVLQGWDVNEHGDIVVGGGVVPAGEQVDGLSIGFDRFSHTSINNHGDFTRLVDIRTDGARLLPGIGIFSPDGVQTFPTDEDPTRAYVNDQRQIAYQIDTDDLREFRLLDPETGEKTVLISVEDTDLYDYVFIHDFNNAGQVSLQLEENYFLGTPVSTPIADLDLNAITTSNDIDRLALAIRDSSTRPKYDLNQDGHLDSADFDFWIDVLVGTSVGDANLDMDVDFEDFLILSGQFGQVSGWSGGDFDGSGDTQFNDFLLLSSAFGSTSNPLLAVPEPDMSVIVLVSFLFGFRRFLKSS